MAHMDISKNYRSAVRLPGVLHWVHTQTQISRNSQFLKLAVILQVMVSMRTRYKRHM